jgi:hypothetical protein
MCNCICIPDFVIDCDPINYMGRLAAEDLPLPNGIFVPRRIRERFDSPIAKRYLDTRSHNEILYWESYHQECERIRLIKEEWYEAILLRLNLLYLAD